MDKPALYILMITACYTARMIGRTEVNLIMDADLLFWSPSSSVPVKRATELNTLMYSMICQESVIKIQFNLMYICSFKTKHYTYWGEFTLVADD